MRLPSTAQKRKYDALDDSMAEDDGEDISEGRSPLKKIKARGVFESITAPKRKGSGESGGRSQDGRANFKRRRT